MQHPNIPPVVKWVVATHFFLGIFTPIFGEMIQFDEHIFQMGWFNHQLVNAWTLFSQHVVFSCCFLFFPRDENPKHLNLNRFLLVKKRKIGWNSAAKPIVCWLKRGEYYEVVSKNNGTPKSSILIWCSIINHPFWGTPIFGNIHEYTLLSHGIH